ncbi:tyrosine--tRNA ligase [bacterium]|nr:tyrosine--tRNA ligase [bacterium]
MKKEEKILEKIRKNTVEIIPEEELIKKLNRGKPLRIKFGADPTAPDIHLGHVVILRKLKQFQELGHEILFIIGDFTAQIGDPSGKSETRKPVTKEKIIENTKTYADQIFKILDKSRTKLILNSQWFNHWSLEDMIKLSAHYTVAQMLARADFSKRYKQNTDITILEFIYPLLQGFDSVELKADVEIGGTDQKFNLLVGRELQRDFGQEPQIVITLPLLEGTDGVKKMSKSLNNYIGVTDSPQDMFGKIMSISDELMLKYYQLLTDISLGEVKGQHPRDAKRNLAKHIVAMFYDQNISSQSEKDFEKIFVSKEIPRDIEEIEIKEKTIWIIDMLLKANLVKSKNEAKRLIRQGGVKVNQKKIEDENLDLIMDKEYILQVGKRSFKKIVPL